MERPNGTIPINKIEILTGNYNGIITFFRSYINTQTINILIAPENSIFVS